MKTKMIEHIVIRTYSDRNLIVLESNYSINGMYAYLKEFYSLLLEKIFVGFDISLITLNPTKDAIGKELINGTYIKISKDKLLVNNCQNADSNLIVQVVHSIEFELGLLAIVKKDNCPIEESTQLTYKYFNQDIETADEKIKQTFCYCEPDGYIIYLVNSGLIESDIREIAKDIHTSSGL